MSKPLVVVTGAGSGIGLATATAFAGDGHPVLAEPTQRRPYRMEARAEAAAATAERILDAAVEAFWELPPDRFSLDEVARRAGVSVQTVIRRFGGRDGLFAAFVAPGLARRSGVERRRRLAQLVAMLAQLVAICDVYTWKLLRRDAGLSRRQTELAMVELLEPMMGGP